MRNKIGVYRQTNTGDCDWRVFGSHVDGKPLTLKECKEWCQKWMDTGRYDHMTLMYVDSGRTIKRFR